MNNLIKKMIYQTLESCEIEAIIENILFRIIQEGPMNRDDLEILAVCRYYQNSIFIKYESRIANAMGIFYKDTQLETIYDEVFEIFRNAINEKLGGDFNPIQYMTYKSILDQKYYSFSAGTSVGKSFVFRKLVTTFQNDIVIIVPSRALISEYIMELNKIFEDDRSTTIISFADLINTKNSKRNIFVLTPERARELFKFKNEIKVDIFLLDEAQLSEDDSIRGLIFDTIVRRIINNFEESKIVFAHPFIDNPESQFIKHNISYEPKNYNSYKYYTVGQIFFGLDHNSGQFYHFGINKVNLGFRKQQINFDPILKVIDNGGSALIYGQKEPILRGDTQKKYGKYVEYIVSSNSDLSDDGHNIINRIEDLIGVEPNSTYSLLINHMRKRIVFHHGSLPLDVRVLVERFVREGHAILCFSTSTLSQGVNMPFDIIIVDIMSDKSLDILNLIGRAGRSTTSKEFNVGQIVINYTRIAKIRNKINASNTLVETSFIDNDFEGDDARFEDDYSEFKEAVKNNEFNDTLNLPQSTVEHLSSDQLDKTVIEIIENLIDKNLEIVKMDEDIYVRVLKSFGEIYSWKLKRKLSVGEAKKVEEANKIMIFMLKGVPFSTVVNWRYRKLKSNGYLEKWIRLPDKSCNYQFSLDVKQINIFDRVVYDTYDYIDKTIGFVLSDIYIAVLTKYYERTDCEKAKALCNYIRYSSNNTTHIMMKRYGFSEDEIIVLEPFIISTSTEEIKLSQKFKTISNPDLTKKADRYNYQKTE